MLLDVTAFLTTPAIATIVAGVLGMSPLAPVDPADALPERPAAVSVVTLSGSGGGAGGGLAAGIPQPFIGPDPVGGGSSLDTIARLDGVALLDQLVRLDSGERDAFVTRYPEAIGDLLATPPAASAVTTWWLRTPGPARAQLTSDLPGVVGNLEGLPYTVRDAANRAFLTETVFGIHEQLDGGVGRAMEDELRARLRMLSSVEEALRTGESGARRSLVSLDVTGPGRAVIAVGDLATADYVTFFVPGMYVGVAEQLVDWTGNAETSLLEQRAWLEQLGMDAEVATVAWIGYHTPTLVNIAGLDLAYEGRDALTWSLQGLDSVRNALADREAASTPGSADAPAGPSSTATPGAAVTATNVTAAGEGAPAASAASGRPYVSIVAHSYGSTAAMLALQENDVTVDALVLVGSPGSPATSVDDLKVTGGNVWVAAAESDPIPASGVFGSQPLDADFGAHRFSVEEMPDPLTGRQLDGITGHVYYFWPGTTAVRNTALIALGQGALVTDDGTSQARATRK